ncbi:hypothetical protein WN51_01757 [Melipona quadrifasciata]|uniref:Uncharacterized protein n=1 Tax=Melipona quadrifasciata TaxID=166423 RepID=A0A0M8ZXC7_9HYME|nr:hypothetical protein WN51_01757 [Melipona quadrifasciata]
MPTQVTPCSQKQVIRKHVRNVLCPRIKLKKQKEVLCVEDEHKGSCKQIEDACCTSKRIQSVTCPSKQVEKKCVQAKTCTERERKTSSRGYPKCESNRIQKLEHEVYQLRKEIECMKHERKETQKVIQKAILPGTCTVGGRFKSTVPGSIEKLLDICNSNASFQSTSLVTLCAAKADQKLSPTIEICHNKTWKKEKELDCCEMLSATADDLSRVPSSVWYSPMFVTYPQSFPLGFMVAHKTCASDAGLIRDRLKQRCKVENVKAKDGRKEKREGIEKEEKRRRKKEKKNMKEKKKTMTMTSQQKQATLGINVHRFQKETRHRKKTKSRRREKIRENEHEYALAEQKVCEACLRTAEAPRFTSPPVTIGEDEKSVELTFIGKLQAAALGTE